MAKQRLKKMVITVTPQTAYHLREMAGMCHYKSVGRVVDKLVREKERMERDPVYSSTDWNYIRFDCAGLQYEMINGELVRYEV